MKRSAVTLLALGIPAAVLGHGGGLDANGCHTNRKTGDYHCHRAPARSPSVPSASSRAPAPASSGINSLYSPSQAPPTSLSTATTLATERQLVLTAQLLLVALGYSPGKQDGIMTPSTGVAIRAFQSDRSLAQDGIVNGPLLVRLAEQVALRAKTS